MQKCRFSQFGFLYTIVDGERLLIDGRTDETELYLATDVDALQSELHDTNEALAACQMQGRVAIEQRDKRIAELEKALRFYAEAQDFYLTDASGQYHDDGKSVAKSVL